MDNQTGDQNSEDKLTDKVIGINESGLDEPRVEPVAPDLETINGVIVQKPIRLKRALHRSLRSKRFLLEVLILILVIGFGGYYIYAKNFKEEPPTVNQPQTNNSTNAVADSLISSLCADWGPSVCTGQTVLQNDSTIINNCPVINMDLGNAVYKWETTPRLINDASMFTFTDGVAQSSTSSSETFKKENIKYYQVGTLNNEALIVLVSLKSEYRTTYLLAYNAGGLYYIFTKYSPDVFYQSGTSTTPDTYSGPVLASGNGCLVNRDISQLNIPETLEYKDQKLNVYAYGTTFVEITEPVKINDNSYSKLESTGGGVLYEAYKDEAVRRFSRYELMMPDHRMYSYGLNLPIDIDNNSGTPKTVTWGDGTKYNDYYSSPLACTDITNIEEVASKAADSDVEMIGSLDDSTPIYGFTSLDNPLLKLHYDEYVNNFRSSAYEVLPINRFNEKHAIILVKDKIGRYIVKINSNFLNCHGRY